MNRWLAIPALGLVLLAQARAIENIHFGFDTNNPAMTDALRLSSRTGTNWWSLNTTRLNPENLMPIPYAYHDGYVELIGASKPPAEAADRWYKILRGQGDPWTGATPLDVGFPSIILLDELTTSFKDTNHGPAFRLALEMYLTNALATRNDLVAYCSPSLSLTPNTQLYTNIVFCANNYLRFLALELFATQEGYVTGYERDQPGVYRGTNDVYLINRYIVPIQRWANAGISSSRLLPTLTVANYGDANGTTAKPFYKFLNRQFWLMANGWSNTNHTSVDTNIQRALRNGVGSYTWTPGTNTWNLVPTETNLDSRFESYLKWYSVDGNLAPHPDGVDAGPNLPPTLAAIPNLTVNASGSLSYTNAAFDNDFPPNNLLFSLDPGAPAGAAIDSTTGVFAWTAPMTSSLVTNSITVRVTDDGSPPLSAARAFMIIVIPPPQLGSLTFTNGTASLTWSSFPGKMYRVQYKDQLDNSPWLDLLPDVSANGTTASKTDGPQSSQRFYRVLLLN